MISSCTELRIIRLPELMNRTGLSRSSIYKQIAERLLPPSISLGGKSVGWPEAEVHAVIAYRVAGKPDNEIQAFVESLVIERQSILEAV